MKGETCEDRRFSEEKTERENHRSATRFETYANVSLPEKGPGPKVPFLVIHELRRGKAWMMVETLFLSYHAHCALTLE